jgi:hypothetical protein
MEYNTYLSDDEEETDNVEMVELDQYGMPIEIVDEEEELEIKRIISNKMLSLNNLNEDFFNGNSSKKKIFKEFKSPKKNTMSLNDLNNLIDKKIEDKKPKKFISLRSMKKKILDASTEPIVLKEYKRHFNPRLIPYFFSDEYKNKKNIF